MLTLTWTKTCQYCDVYIAHFAITATAG